MSNKKILSRLLLSFCAGLFLLIIVELGLHFFYPVSYMSPPVAVPVKLLFVRESKIPGLIYELAPDKHSNALSLPISTNSYGMRDDEPVISDTDHVHRIIAIGDSFTFGYGVRGEDSYPNVLEKMLNRENGAKKFEVLNLGLGGYSTQQEAIVLKYKGLMWDPELIIIGYVLNDPEIDPLQPLPAYFSETEWWQYVNIFRLIAKLKNIYNVQVLGGGDYFIYLHNDKRKWQSVVTGFESVRDSAAANNIPVLLVVFPMIVNEDTKSKEEFWGNYLYKDLHKRVTNLAEDNGFYVIDLYDYYSSYPPLELKVSPRNHHPSELGHKVASEAIFDWIIKNQNLFPLTEQNK